MEGAGFGFELDDRRVERVAVVGFGGFDADDLSEDANGAGLEVLFADPEDDGVGERGEAEDEEDGSGGHGGSVAGVKAAVTVSV